MNTTQSTYLMSQSEINALVVNNAIAQLNAIDIDGETMQFIIDSLGMNEQMLRQLIMSNPESDIKDLLQEKVSLSDQRLQSIQESKLITTYRDGQQVYEGDKFVNQCDITNEGMNEGWIVGNGDMYIKYESDAVKFCKSNYNMTLQEAYDNELIYWTEWDIVDCDEFCYQIENGQLTEIKFKFLNNMNTRIITINTTAFNEESFYVLTSLTDSEIKSAIEPIVKAERNGGDSYDNYDLIEAMVKAYPSAVIEMYTDLDTLSI